MLLKDQKMLVLGFDGASPKLIDEWIDYLPNFQRFKKLGIFGQTIPPIPAQTPVAWATLMTGKNPGNHGIYGYAFRQHGSYERKIINTQMLKSKTLWRILSEAKRRVGIINVPMGDAEDVRGFIIPGFVSSTEGVPYPNRVKEKVERKFGIQRLHGDVEVEVLDKVESDPDLFFESVNNIADETAEISLYLLQEEQWDFFMTVFMSLDRIQHFFWKYVDPTHPRYEVSRYTKLAKDFYVKSDKIVGNFLKSVGENTCVMVLSDHGFCPIYEEVMINNYLQELGFLTTKSGKVDLEKSKAVSYGYGDIWLNIKDREPKGFIEPKVEYDDIRNEVSKELQKIDIGGKKPIKDVKKREELYWGTHLEEAPDLTIIFNVGWQAARQPEITKRNKINRYVRDKPRWSGGHDGAHDPLDVPGILGVLQPHIRGGQEIKVHLWDVAPTILKLMHIPIPPDMDGKPFLQNVNTKAYYL